MVPTPENEDLLPDAEVEEEEEFGWSFHKWPFLIAVGLTVVIYILIFTFVSPNPPYFDPADLPPPPSGS